MEFKDRIKHIRQENNNTLTDLGAALGKTESACRAWELGRTKPDADTLIKLAKYFNCTTDYLLGLDGFKNPEHEKLVHEKMRKIFNAFSIMEESLVRTITHFITSTSSFSDAHPGVHASMYLESLLDIIGTFEDVVRDAVQSKDRARLIEVAWLMYDFFSTSVDYVSNIRDEFLSMLDSCIDEEEGGGLFEIMHEFLRHEGGDYNADEKDNPQG